jgi:endonuclease IV
LVSDIQELQYLQAGLEYPEKVTFYIDTAHAHVFGCRLQHDPEGFVTMVDQLLISMILKKHRDHSLIKIVFQVPGW